MKYLKIISIILGIIISAGIIISLVDKHFAKEAKVQVIEQRLDLKVQDDRIFQQRQDINRYKSLAEFERKDGPPTKTENEIIILEIEKLKRLEKDREQMIEQRGK